jgi:colanic acid/amylovoran biosynthesis glycosyltransferase
MISTMRIRVAQVWDEYVAKSMVEVQPLFSPLGVPVDSFTIVRTLWDNGNEPDATLLYHQRRSDGELRGGSLLFRARGYLERRFLRGSFLRFARKGLDERKVDLVHFNFGFTAAQYPELPAGRPFLVTFYGSDVSSGVRDPYWRRRYQEVLPRASALLVLCEEAKARLVSLGCDPAKVHVWNLPAGVEKYPYREPPPPEKAIRFITTARFVEKKGHGILLEALSLLEAKGVEFCVTLVGYSKGITWVREEIDRRNLGSKVRVVDTQYRGDFVSLHNAELRGQDFFVMPSVVAKNGDDEGGPALSMVVAQAAGLPVVCTRFPGAEITMAEGATGFFVPEPNAPALAATIERMARARDQWRGMGLEGRRLALRNFGEKEQVGKLAELYQSLLPR